jgi:hypothetical protein
MRLLILIFLVKICLSTEGVSQKQEETEVIQTVDSTYNEEDSEVDEAEDIPYVNPYQQAQENYQKDPINQNDFDPNSWQKAKEGLDYTLEPVKKDTTVRKPSESKSLDPATADFILTLVKWFFVSGAMAILVYLIARFIGEGNVFGRQSRRVYAPSVAIDLEHIEDNLEQAELNPYIKKAIEKKEFALAIRLYYLAILKELSAKEVIQWKKDKTNRIYVLEMRPHHLFQSFRNQTSVFERVWYGDAPLDENGFYQIQPDFQELWSKMKV